VEEDPSLDPQMTTDSEHPMKAPKREKKAQEVRVEPESVSHHIKKEQMR